jgi:hypothetical protein
MQISNSVFRTFTSYLQNAAAVPVAVDTVILYDSVDPYAVTLSFEVGLPEKVEWIFARNLLADGLISRSGEGDVVIYPQELAPANTILEVTSPFGQATFIVESRVFFEFLDTSYKIVPMSQEADLVYAGMDGELAELLKASS